MMWHLAFICLLTGCITSLDAPSPKKGLRNDVVIGGADGFDQNARDFHLTIATQDDKLTIAALKKRLMMVHSPHHECLAEIDREQKVSLSIIKHAAQFDATTS